MGFTTKGKRVEDFGPRMISRHLPAPEDVEMLEEIPGRHGMADFSMMHGERISKNRPLTYVYQFIEHNPEHRNFVKRQIENWLLRGSYENLYDDSEPLYYYRAKATAVETSIDEARGVTEYTILFDAYPFKIKETPEDDPYWDTKDITDYVQETSFVVSGSKTITLVNVGIVGVVPTITATANFTINKGSRVFTVKAGKTTSEKFRLEEGSNMMLISGSGTISFSWHKEVK